MGAARGGPIRHPHRGGQDRGALRSSLDGGGLRSGPDLVGACSRKQGFELAPSIAHGELVWIGPEVVVESQKSYSGPFYSPQPEPVPGLDVLESEIGRAPPGSRRSDRARAPARDQILRQQGLHRDVVVGAKA